MHKEQTKEVHIIRAFADAGMGGNPAGVVLDADHLTNEQKQYIAAQVGLSETAFVSTSKVADIKLEFFTPNRQIAHCGHATVATFAYLNQIGRITKKQATKETIDGLRSIFLTGDRVFMEQLAPRYTNLDHERLTVLQALGLASGDLLSEAPVTRVDTGNAFAIVPVVHPEVLQRIRPDMGVMEALSERHDLIGLYVFTQGSMLPGRDVTTRMFAPRYGIPEESATGMAAGQLGCYLHDVLKFPQQRFLIEQGHFMAEPSPSLIQTDVTLDFGKITSVMAGGTGEYASTLSIEL
ncbi:MAG: PhzF family phenazine biosynthesis protein [Saprospiraceae bacterium]|nr:PhzF family phenazine biosynthesis protein [Saprospiraceae bacterium]